MDSHKKNMIRKWVEHQTFQIQKTKHPPSTSHSKNPREETEDETVVRPLSSKKHESVEESVIRTGLKLSR